MPWNDVAIEYFRKHQTYVLRDLEALKTGRIQIKDAGKDATDIWIARSERQLAHVNTIIEAYEQTT